MKDRSHDEAMTHYFRASPAYAEALLAEVRPECSGELLLLLTADA